MTLDWSKVGWKFVVSGVYVLVAGLASVYGENPMYLAVAPALAALENYLKHRSDF